MKTLGIVSQPRPTNILFATDLSFADHLSDLITICRSGSFSKGICNLR
jgi:hypothetical protein